MLFAGVLMCYFRHVSSLICNYYIYRRPGRASLSFNIVAFAAGFAIAVIASCYKDDSSRAILEREFGRTELLVDYLDVAETETETETTYAQEDSLGEDMFRILFVEICLHTPALLC